MEDRQRTLYAALQEERDAHNKESTTLNNKIQDMHQINTKLACQLSEHKAEYEEICLIRAKLEQKLIGSESQFADEEANLTKELHALQAQYRELQHSSDKQSIALTSKEREATRLKDEKVRRQ